MNYLKSFFHVIIFSLLLLCKDTYVGMPPDFNMENFEQELLEANKAIEEYVAGLSPEEQAEFNKAVDEFSQMLDNMSEDEFSQFLEGMFEEPAPHPEVTEIPMLPTAEPIIEAPTFTKEQKQKIETILIVLENIIRQSNIFIVQTQSSIELGNLIDKWRDKGEIAYWPPSADWDTVKTDIEKFIQKLYKAEEQNVDTKEYKYLIYLIEDEALLNNLIQLQTNLNKSVPKIEMPELSMEKLSSATKENIKNVLQHYAESLYLLQLPKALDDLFVKYKPQEEKIKEAEEAAEKRALEATKRPRVPAAPTEAGVAYEGMEYGFGSYGPSYSYDYTPSYAAPSYYGGMPSYSPYGGGYAEEESFAPSKGGGGGGGRARAGGLGEPTEAAVPEGEKKEEDKKKEKAPFVKNPAAKKALSDIKDAVKSITDIFDRQPLFETLVEHITSDQPVNKELALNIPLLNRKIKTFNDKLTVFDSIVKKLDSNTQKYYKKEEATATTEVRDLLKKLVNNINEINYEKNKDVILPEKQWAYFNNDKALEKMKKTKAETEEDRKALANKIEDLESSIPARMSLIELKENIEQKK